MVTNILLIVIFLVGIYWILTDEGSSKLLNALRGGAHQSGGLAVDGFGRAICKAWGC